MGTGGMQNTLDTGSGGATLAVVLQQEKLRPKRTEFQAGRVPRSLFVAGPPISGLPVAMPGSRVEFLTRSCLES